MTSIISWVSMPIVRLYVERDAIGQIPILLENAEITVDPDEKYWSCLWELDYRGVIWVRGSYVRVSAKPVDDKHEVILFGLPPIWKPIACLRGRAVARKASRALRRIARKPPGKYA